MPPKEMPTPELLVDLIHRYHRERNLQDLAATWLAFKKSGYRSKRNNLFADIAAYHKKQKREIMIWAQHFYDLFHREEAEVKRLLLGDQACNIVEEPEEHGRPRADKSAYPLRELPILDEMIISCQPPPYEAGESQEIRVIEKESWSYPDRFGSRNRRVFGGIVQPSEWKTLRPGYRIPRSMLDCWSSLMANSVDDRHVLAWFDSCDRWIKEKKRSSLLALVKWLKENRCETKNIWLIPYSKKIHTSLLIIVRDLKTFVFMDALHGEPSQVLKDRICIVMENALSEPIDWSEWSFYIPKDYKQQDCRSNDCIIFVCAWMYMICSGARFHCRPSAMGTFRKIMAVKLYHAPEDRPDTKLAKVGPITLDTTGKGSTLVNYIHGSPPGAKDTEAWCSSILNWTRNPDSKPAL